LLFVIASQLPAVHMFDMTVFQLIDSDSKAAANLSGNFLVIFITSLENLHLENRNMSQCVNTSNKHTNFCCYCSV